MPSTTHAEQQDIYSIIFFTFQYNVFTKNKLSKLSQQSLWLFWLQSFLAVVRWIIRYISTKDCAGYTTTKKELLAIVETLKEFRNILMGQNIKVYSDHKKLTYKMHNSAQVMCWRLTFKEFSPELIYTPGAKI